MADDKKPEGSSEEEKPQEPQAPSEEGKATKQVQVEPTIPEKFTGKTIEDVAKAYLELEKKYGAHSQEVKQVRDQLAEWEVLGKVIQGNPTLYKAVEDEIGKISGKNTAGEQTKDDTRLAVENNIIGSFESRYGIDKLDTEKRKELHVKIGAELGDMFDPRRTKSYAQVLDEIPLDMLPNYLEKAYRLATMNDQEEKARAEGYLQARQNSQAALGSIPSSGANSETKQLTPQQREAARRMKISEADYIKQLEELEKE